MTRTLLLNSVRIIKKKSTGTFKNVFVGKASRCENESKINDKADYVAPVFQFAVRNVIPNGPLSDASTYTMQTWTYGGKSEMDSLPLPTAGTGKTLGIYL